MTVKNNEVETAVETTKTSENELLNVPSENKQFNFLQIKLCVHNLVNPLKPFLLIDHSEFPSLKITSVLTLAVASNHDAHLCFPSITSFVCLSALEIPILPIYSFVYLSALEISVFPVISFVQLSGVGIEAKISNILVLNHATHDSLLSIFSLVQLSGVGIEAKISNILALNHATHDSLPLIISFVKLSGIGIKIPPLSSLIRLSALEISVSQIQSSTAHRDNMFPLLFSENWSYLNPPSYTVLFSENWSYLNPPTFTLLKNEIWSS